MTEQPPTPSIGQVSPDGQQVWDGSAWAPNPNLPKQKKKHTVRNVLLIVGIGLVLVVGGCIALIGSAVNEVAEDIKADANKPGGTDNPLTIVVGEAFEVDGFQYSPGWSLGADGLGDADITELKVTNKREERDAAIVEIKLWTGTEVLATIDCTTEKIDVGTTVTLGCYSGDDMPADYEKVTINDTY